MLTRCHEIMADVCDSFDVTLVEFNGEADHIHLLVEFPPKVALSKLINSLKGVSSRYLRSEFPQITRHVHQGHLWSPSYYAGSVGGAPISRLREYIETQNSPTT